MKKLLCFCILFLLLAVQTTWGQSPKTIEGVALDSKGIPLPDGTKEITFNIYDSIDGDVLLWSEQQTVAIKDGRFSATLGSVNSLELRETKTYWLTMKVGAGNELTPRIELKLGENDDTTAQKSALTSHTLDDAYDGGTPGSGSGRIITADAGAVHILGSDGVVSSFPAIGGKDFLVLENNGNSNVSIIGGAANSSALKFFPSGATGNVGVITYNYANDQMTFGTVNGTTRMTINAANGIGIGTAGPNGKLGIAQVAGTNRWLDIEGDSNAPVSVSIQPVNTNTTGGARGLSIVPVMKASAPGTAGYGVQIDTQPQTNLGGFNYGTLAIAQLSNSSSSVSNYFPMFFRFDTQSSYTGLLDTVDVFRIQSPILNGSKPLNITGLNIVNQGAGSITNAYGLRVLAQSGATNNWNIYSEGASSRNFFEGNVGIGTDTPSTNLEVAGQVKITGGSPGAGKVLTSDATGLATWETGTPGPTGPTGPTGATGATGGVTSHTHSVHSNQSFGLDGALGDGITAFLGPGLQTVHATDDHFMLCTSIGIILKVAVWADIPPGSGETLDVILRLDEADTAMTVQLSGTTQVGSNTSFFNVIGGRRISVKLVNSASSLAANISITIEVRYTSVPGS
ncbi:hypothetical protein IID10_15855 [candidate division KSB1 bacterium]|nr:hypothetical protein [candidate division KSB1 bacterium]